VTASGDDVGESGREAHEGVASARELAFVGPTQQFAIATRSDAAAARPPARRTLCAPGNSDVSLINNVPVVRRGSAPGGGLERLRQQ
jgi:hypothetical protein